MRSYEIAEYILSWAKVEREDEEKARRRRDKERHAYTAYVLATVAADLLSMLEKEGRR